MEKENQSQHVPVYPHPVEYAREHGELAAWRENRDQNAACTQAIDKAIQLTNYELYHYDLKTAAKAVIAEYGAERVNHVLANILLNCDYDGRYSRANKEWARDFDIVPDKGIFCNTHPTVLDCFIDRARSIAAELEKPAGILPFEKVGGYTIREAVLFENDRGFAWAENLTAPDKFVTWQYTEENGVRDMYWGHYVGSEQSARDDFAKRVGDYKMEYGFSEKYNYLAATEMSTEQNYNMIDGLRNNAPSEKADLTDGQTYTEIRELVPETLRGERPSVLEQLKSARDAHDLPEPAAPKLKKDRGELEL